jgi:hypothetical protein
MTDIIRLSHAGRPVALSGETEAAAMPVKLPEPLSARAEAFGSSLACHGASGFGRSPQGPIGGPEQRKVA